MFLARGLRQSTRRCGATSNRFSASQSPTTASLPNQLSLSRAADFVPATMIGTSLGGYHLQALIGAGGMGEVYRAHDAKLGRDVAIKILPSAFTSIA